MQRVSLVLLFTFLAIVMVSGCTGLMGDTPLSEEALARIPPALKGDWMLASMETGGQKTVISPGTPVDISFMHPSMIRGDAGCALYSAPYTLIDSTPTRGPQVTIGEPALVKDNCSQGAVEQQYLSAIPGTWSYLGDGNSLRLTSGNGNVLVYQRKKLDPVTEVVTALPTTPAPVEMAYLEDTLCMMDETSGTSYHCYGKVRIKSGVYSEVQVIAKYPDNNTFESGIFPMGGSNPVLKSFSIFPDVKYKGMEPQFFVRLDKTRYQVNRNGNSGTAYINPPPTQVTIPWHAVVTTTPTVRPTTSPTTSPTTPAAPAKMMKVVGSGLSVSTISPGTAPVGLQQFYITGTHFRQYPPPEVYLRKQGSSCEYCGVHATRVQYLTPEKISCEADFRGPEGGPGTYDVLVTNSYLADSYAMLTNSLTVR